MCVSYINGSVQQERLLECTHDEADDRLLYHMNHAVKVGYLRSVVIAAEDTNVFGVTIFKSSGWLLVKAIQKLFSQFTTWRIFWRPILSKHRVFFFVK